MNRAAQRTREGDALRLVGVIPEDMPDPRLETIEYLRRHMPIPLLGLVAQPHLEDWDCLTTTRSSLNTGSPLKRGPRRRYADMRSIGMRSTGNEIVYSITVGIDYTLWRNPDDRDDPVNLAELDDATRHFVEAQPPTPQPGWLTEYVQRRRYPSLHDAVRTSWAREPVPRRDAGSELVAHVNHLLRNRYHAPPTPGSFAHGVADEGPSGLVDERCIERGVPVVIDGAEADGIRIDTDPHVFALGADLGSQGILTAVIDRNTLPYVTLAFAQRPLTR